MTIANNTTPSKVPHFQVNDKNGRYIARHTLTDTQIIKAAKTILNNKICRADLFTDSETTKDYLIAHFSGQPHEVFICLFCDNRHRLISCEVLASGTVDGATVYPRNIVKRCLELNAAAVIFAHNHPSGDPTPSAADIALTECLKGVLKAIDVRPLDHVIVGGGKAISFNERGIL